MQTLFFGIGSPADNDNLEVGDEILEVNGKTLEDANHTEVINHIHQVRTISLLLYLHFNDFFPVYSI